jgi:hypothetical protein
MYICVLCICIRRQIEFPHIQLYCFCNVHIFFNLKRNQLISVLFSLERQSSSLADSDYDGV